jgi:hypothetical protein
VLLKDFKAYAANLTAEVRQAAEEVAVQQGRPIVYLHNSGMDKEAWARDLAQRDGIQQGLIGVLKAVEGSHLKENMMASFFGDDPQAENAVIETLGCIEIVHVDGRLSNGLNS